MTDSEDIWETNYRVTLVHGTDWFTVAVRRHDSDVFRSAVWLGVPVALRWSERAHDIAADDRSDAYAQAVAWCFRRHRLGARAAPGTNEPPVASGEPPPADQEG